MAQGQREKNPFTLPSLTATWKLPYQSQHGSDDHQFFDVRFWPYSNQGDCSPVFAVVGSRDVLICGTRVKEDGLADVYLALSDKEAVGVEELPILNTCSWVYIDEETPLLALSGPSGKIKIIEACAGLLLTTLIGHGAGLINDLATHPLYPWILASASIDSSIRIWDIRRWEDEYESPCIVICGQGHGHKEGILKIAWHRNGRYIISGAHDNTICLWTIPDLSDQSNFWTSISPAVRKSKSDAVHVVYYPHFVTAAVHSNYVDCLCFYGDMILSKAASDSEENKIVLWEITGFDSNLPPPSQDQAPKTQEHMDTRSCFKRKRTELNGTGSYIQDSKSRSREVEDENTALYSQLLEFDLPKAMPFYVRFGLLMPSQDFPDLHTVLVCGNTDSEIYMWDFERLVLGHTDGYQTLPPNGRPKHEHYIEVDEKKKSHKKQMKAPTERHLSMSNRQTPSGSQTSSTNQAAAESLASQPETVPNRERYPISDPFVPIKPHKIIQLPDYMNKTDHNTCFRSVSWSPCGRWCVVVGDCETPIKGSLKRDAQGALLSRWL